MTDLRFYTLVAIPLVGILTNISLFLHLSGRLDRLSDRLDARIDRVAESNHSDMKGLNRAITALETDVALLKDKVGI